MAKFSIIIPLYNKEQTIARTINSIIRQDYDDYEIIVVDDGSNDHGGAVVESMKDNRIRLVRKANGGVSSARNYGVKCSSGEWLIFMDADDEMGEGALKAFYDAILDHPNQNVFIAEEINKLQVRPHTNRQIKKIDIPLFYVWLGKLHPRPGALLINRSLFTKGYDERISFYEDFLFMLTLLAKNSAVMIPKVTVIYNNEPNSLSKSNHPLNREMAYYIPEILAKGNTTFWERVLLYGNIEQEIGWWWGNDENVRFYRDMQRKHFAWYHKYLHWLRAQMRRHHII